MKKAIMLAFLALGAMTLCSSCDEQNTIDVKYNVLITGDAVGDVLVTFPDGKLDLNGTTAIDFKWGNADAESGAKLATTGKAFEKASAAVAEDLAKNFSAASTTGTYDVIISGYAEAYGVRICIDEHFTNRE